MGSSDGHRNNCDGAAAPTPEGDPGRSLRDIRKQRGMTLSAASELTSLPVSTLSKRGGVKAWIHHATAVAWRSRIGIPTTTLGENRRFASSPPTG